MATLVIGTEQSLLYYPWYMHAVKKMICYRCLPYTYIYMLSNMRHLCVRMSKSIHEKKVENMQMIDLSTLAWCVNLLTILSIYSNSNTGLEQNLIHNADLF